MKYGSLKTIMMATSLFIVVSFATFQAFLTSHLSFQFDKLPFENLEELYKKSDYVVGAVRGTSLEAKFHVS